MKMGFTIQRGVPAAIAVGLAAWSSVASAAVLDITTLSNKPHLISGGNALVQLTTDAAGLAGPVTLNGVNVSAQFQPGRPPIPWLAWSPTQSRREHGRRGWQELGDHQLSDQRADLFRSSHAALHLPKAAFRLPDGPFLGAPTDADVLCGRPDYLHVRAAGRHRARCAASTRACRQRQDDIANGASVPFVVRVETGTMNRGIYQNAVLHDPTQRPHDPVHAAPRLEPPPVRSARAGCAGGWYVQGDSQA